MLGHQPCSMAGVLHTVTARRDGSTGMCGLRARNLLRIQYIGLAKESERSAFFAVPDVPYRPRKANLSARAGVKAFEL